MISGANGIRTYVQATAAAACLIAAIAAIVEGATVTPIIAAIATALVLVSLPVPARRDSPSIDVLVDRTAREVESRRKLVIYDDVTGLYAPWYVALRCEEECYRSQRYHLPFSLLVVEAGVNSNSWAIQGALADWLTRKRRRSDIAGSLGNGRFLLLMPETDAKQAQEAAARLGRAVAGVKVGLSHHAEDGDNFDQLREAAMRRLGQASQAAA